MILILCAALLGPMPPDPGPALDWMASPSYRLRELGSRRMEAVCRRDHVVGRRLLGAGLGHPDPEVRRRALLAARRAWPCGTCKGAGWLAGVPQYGGDVRPPWSCPDCKGSGFLVP